MPACAAASRLTVGGWQPHHAQQPSCCRRRLAPVLTLHRALPGTLLSQRPNPWPASPLPSQVALAAGYLDPEPRELVVPLRKQVVVVVTEAWHVMAFDHNLGLLWEGDVDGASARPAARLHEVAVAISHARVRQGDRGLVVIGGDVALGREGGDGGITGGGGVGGVLDGVLRDELRWEEEQETQRGPPRDRSLGGTARDGGAGVEAGSMLGAGADASRHFDYFAFEGGGGEPRWSHRAGSFQSGELEAAAEELVPQASFKLDADKLAGRHYGELSCREFRGPILRALPHYWGGGGDTRMQAAAFVRHREGVGAQRARLAATAAARDAGEGRARVERGTRRRAPRARAYRQTGQQPVSCLVHVPAVVTSLPPCLPAQHCRARAGAGAFARWLAVWLPQAHPGGCLAQRVAARGAPRCAQWQCQRAGHAPGAGAGGGAPVHRCAAHVNRHGDRAAAAPAWRKPVATRPHLTRDQSQPSLRPDPPRADAV